MEKNESGKPAKTVHSIDLEPEQNPDIWPAITVRFGDGTASTMRIMEPIASRSKAADVLAFELADTLLASLEPENRSIWRDILLDKLKKYEAGVGHGSQA